MNTDVFRTAYEALSPERRELVVESLQRTTLFGNVGQRLLADYVDRLRVYDEATALFQIEELAPIDPTKRKIGPVLDEVSGILGVFVIQKGLVAMRSGGLPIELPQGLHNRFDAALNGIPIGELGLAAVEGTAAKVLLITVREVMASPELAWRVVGIPESILPPPDLERARRPTLIWVAGHADAQIPLPPLMHVLAGAIAQESPHTAIVELGGKVEAAQWDVHEKRFVPRKLDPKVTAATLEELAGDRRGQVFVLNPEDPIRRPERLAGVQFDQIVYVTNQIPTCLPPSLHEILNKETFGRWDDRYEEPYFVSFVPTVPVPLRNPPPGRKRHGFHARKVFDSFVVEPKQPRVTGLRPHRDACVVPIDRQRLRRAWDKWVGGAETNHQSFLDAAVKARAISPASASRWARGVTMRRVGFALSGGGASAYRGLPILWRLHRKGVPVDVFAGLSGGALVGAFYCLKGLDGLGQIADLGPLIQLTMPLATWSTFPFEALLDRILGSARVENLEVRLAAVTVGLPADGSPQGEVVDTGTLGEAARVSGAMPPAFAPTKKRGVRYLDGGACAIVPARIARDHGADVILSCNAIPSPAQSNPFHGWPGGGFLRELPLWDRLIDFDAWRSYMWKEASRRFGEEADAFIEFEGGKMSAFEPMLWMRSWGIVAEANMEGTMIDDRIDRLKHAWEQLGGTPSSK
jgi:hypothetical protein